MKHILCAVIIVFFVVSLMTLANAQDDSAGMATASGEENIATGDQVATGVEAEEEEEPSEDWGGDSSDGIVGRYGGEKSGIGMSGGQEPLSDTSF